MRHSKLQGILAMSPTIEDQIRAFTSWQQKSPPLVKDLIDILELINTRGIVLKSALMSFQSVYDRLSNDRRHSDDIVTDLEKKFSIDLPEKVAHTRDVYVALNKAGSQLSTPNSKGGLGKLSRPRQVESLASFEKLYDQLKEHVDIIEGVTRGLRSASHTQSNAFLKEYNALERMHSKEVLKRLCSRFNGDPFAVTVPLDPDREPSEDEADMIYDYLHVDNGVETFLQRFKDMGSKWAAAMLGAKSTPNMRTLELAYTNLSCGVMKSLQQCIPCDKRIRPLLDDMDFLRCQLARWEELTSGQKLIIAVGGHFSHGKSSFLNALMGEDVLPTNKSFTTAIPCRIQHKAEAELTLEIPQLEPYQDLLTRVTDYALYHKINGIPDDSMVEEAAKFVERCKTANFLRAGSASGQGTKLVVTERKTVREQLDLINNLVRLCSQLRDSKPLKLDSPLVWPIITYDIAVLGLGNVTANVQFLDLPGFNDEIASADSQSALFFSMMKNAAQEATLIIPVVSIQAVNKSFGSMWAEWEKALYQKRWKDRIPAVVVTRAPREEHSQSKFEIIQSKIATKVWKTGKQCNRVMFCDSLIGLGAMQLGRLFNECIENQDQEIAGWKSEYSRTLTENIQNSSGPMRYLKILPSLGSLGYQRDAWSRFLGKAHYRAGVEEFNKFLASKICDQSPRRRLEAFHRIFPTAFQNLISRHKQAIDDLRTPKEDLEIASEIDDTEQVENGLKVWKTTTDGIINGLKAPTRDFQQKFEASVNGEWGVKKEELEKSLLGASSQGRLRKFSSRMEYRCHVDRYINELARSFAVIQAQHVDTILKIVSEGVQKVIDAVDNFTDTTITDATWKEIVATSLKDFRIIPNVLVYRLKAKIEGTAADKNYTAATLLESLHTWAPLTDEPFDLSLGHAPSTQHATYRDSITSPVTLTPALPIPSEPSETDLATPTPEPSTNDHPPDEFQRTTKEWANVEFKDSGFLISVPSPDEWLDTLPTDNAVVSQLYRVAGKETLEVEVDIDRLLTMTEEKFVNRYVKTIMNKTKATSQDWLQKTVEVIERRFKQLMLDRKEELSRLSKVQDNSRGAQVKRVVPHLIAIANLTAANAAIERLKLAVAEWDRLLDQDEDADILVAGINGLRASSPIP